MLKSVKVATADLKLGMFVSGLDRPWLEVPFPLQGFRIESETEIARLQQFCQYVFIDSLKSDQRTQQPEKQITRARKKPQEIFPGRKLKNYQDSHNWAQEYPNAQVAVDTLAATVDTIFDQVNNGGVLDVIKVRQCVEPMIDSISRNPDACIWLARIKQQDSYTYQHSVSASIWAVALGRQLGLPKSDLRSLAVGGLLFDIGKMRIDAELLKATRALTDEEFAVLRSHVSEGAEMIKDSGLMNRDIMDMVAHHHERHNGAGYPAGLKGDAIPVFARIAAIVDCYDAITSHRSYAKALSPTVAIKMLYDWRDVDFQAELIEAFIQAVGIYPAGALVELSSGEVAVVVGEYRTRRLRPKVMVLLDANKQPVEGVKMIDLREELHTEDGSPLDITSSLEPDAYGIDMASIAL